MIPKSRWLNAVLVFAIVLTAVAPAASGPVFAQDVVVVSETPDQQLPADLLASSQSASISEPVFVEPSQTYIVDGTNEVCKVWELDNHLNIPARWDEYQWTGAHTGGVAYRDNAGDGAELTYIFRAQEDPSTPTRGSVSYWRYESSTVAGGALVIELLINGQPSGWGYFNPSGSIGTTINLVNGTVVSDRLSFDGVKVYAQPEANHLAVVGWDALRIEKCYQGTPPTATAVPPTPTATATNVPLPTATDTPLPPPTNTPLPTATNVPLPTATNTAQPTPTNTPLSLPTPTPTGVIVTPVIPTPTATAITLTLPVTTTQVGTISTTVEGCHQIFLPLIQRKSQFGEVEVASVAVTQTVMAPQCIAMPAAIAAMCPTGWTYDWVVYNSDGTPEMEFGRHLTCKGKPDLANAPVLVTIMSEASMSVDPKSAIVAVLKALIPITVIAVWSQFEANDTVGSNQFVVSNPVLVDEWFTGQLYDSPTGLYYGLTLQVDQYSPNGHVKYYSLPSSWPATVRIVKAETAKISHDTNNLALLQYKMNQEVYSFLVQTTAATDGELVTEVSGNAATVVNRVWREAIRANNIKMLTAPEKYFSLYKSFAAGSQENGVNVELYLAAPSNLSNYVVVSSDYAVVAGDRPLDQNLKLWGAIKVGGTDKTKSTGYAVYLASEWYEYVDPADPDYVATVQVADFKYRPAFLPGAHTNLQKLTEALGAYAATVLEHVEAARTEALARVKTKREDCWKKNRYWDEANEKCLRTRPVGSKPQKAPNEDKEPDLPVDEQEKYFPVVAVPAKDCNSWGHARRSRGWYWCDDINDVIEDARWEFLGYATRSGDILDPGPRAAFVLHLKAPIDIDGDVFDKICVPYKFAVEPGSTGYWYIPTAYPFVSLGGCLKPYMNIISSSDRLSPPIMPTLFE